MYPALRGELDLIVQAPVLYVPDIPAIVIDHEVGILQQTSFLNDTCLAQLTSSMAAHLMEADFGTIFHLHASNQEHVRHNYYVTTTVIVIGVTFGMILVYYFTHSYFRGLLQKCVCKSDPEVSAQNPQTSPSTLSLPNLAETQEAPLEDSPPWYLILPTHCSQRNA
jgi:hypothetical protein